MALEVVSVISCLLRSHAYANMYMMMQSSLTYPVSYISHRGEVDYTEMIGVWQGTGHADPPCHRTFKPSSQYDARARDATRWLSQE